MECVPLARIQRRRRRASYARAKGEAETHRTRRSCHLLARICQSWHVDSGLRWVAAAFVSAIYSPLHARRVSTSVAILRRCPLAALLPFTLRLRQRWHGRAPKLINTCHDPRTSRCMYHWCNCSSDNGPGFTDTAAAWNRTADAHSENYEPRGYSIVSMIDLESA